MKRINGLALLLLLLGLLVGLGRVPVAEAGIWNADEEVTYKEYWIPHTQFTGGCTDTGAPTSPGGSWFSEPESLAKCPKTMLLNIPDGISGALRAEVYVDIWRGYDSISPRLKINNGATIYTPTVSYDWSRTPWVFEVPVASLVEGNNSFQFWAVGSRYHIHDVGLRVYYDATHPLVGGGVSPDVTAPTGHLVSIKSGDPGSVVIPAMDGGQLMVNSDSLTLEAQVDMPTDSTWVEFHAYYDGYDDDNDGLRRDWHNVGRNNWFPGGKPGNEVPKFGGVINHIGSVKPDASGKATITWSLPHVVNQSGVRFKIRLIDSNGNAREGAGGVTPDYTLVRNYPVVYFVMPGFDDFGLHMDGARPDSVSYNFPLPADINMAQYNQAYLLGMYWKRPKFSINGSSTTPVRQGGDDWELGVRSFGKSLLTPGNNRIDFFYSGSGQGQFIEHPGPMIVLRGNNAGTDTTGPTVVQRSPSPGSTNVDLFAPVSVRLTDDIVGINHQSIIMTVGGDLVEPVLSGPSNNLTVTYQHTDPLTPSEDILVTVYACDLFGNCMDGAEVFTFTTEPPDTTPPTISNIQVLTTESTAKITWTTDEGADSLVDYGLTTAYGSSVSDGTLVTQHTIELTGLSSQTIYNYQLTSADYNANTATTTNLTFTTKRTPGAIVSDDFSGCTLDTSVWSFINPKGDATLNLTGSAAQIYLPAGSGHDLWRSDQSAPRLMQYVTNPANFGVEVKFESLVTAKVHLMGILAKQDDGNWLRINFQNDGPNNNNLVVVNSDKGKVNVVQTTPVTMTAGSNAYLRVNRIGTIWNVDYSMDGTNWTVGATVDRALTLTEIGPFIGNTGNNPTFTGVIDYFRNLATPFSEDDGPLQLDVQMVGVGTVTRTPDKPNYLCGETVSLTAAPSNPDWTFSGWSGAITSANPTASITLNKSETVTATFTNSNLYTMNVNVVSDGNGVGGSVTKTPEQNGYLYGAEVTLVATPTPGWSFVGWSGSFTGTEATSIVTVTGNMDITATFEEDEYTIEALILTDGFGEGGSITVDPVKSTYQYGEEVTLTLSVNPGWTFEGWEGSGVSGTDPVVHLNMSQDVLAIARLTQNKYNVAINIINDGDTPDPENGVLRYPEQDTYGHGQVLTLTASADQGWTFTGWGGDLSGIEITQTLTITEDKAIDATFTQDHYALTVTVNNPAYGAVTIDPVKDYYVYGDIVKLTPVPVKGYDFATWTGDHIGMEDPLIFPITGDKAVEAVFEVDTTPIEILSQKITVINTVAIVEWTTDVPGTSRVDYGKDQLVSDGTETNETLVTTHKITLTNLAGDTRYYYQIISVDGDGNPVQSDVLTFFTGQSSGMLSDDFSACGLDPLWTFVNPKNDSTQSMTGYQAAITVPGGKPADGAIPHNVWIGAIDAPRLMQEVNDKDFTLEVKFDSALVDAGAMQGILIQQDDTTFLRFNFYKRTDPGQDPPESLVVHAYSFDPGIPGGSKQLGNNPRFGHNGSGPMYMRIVRTGNTWQHWYSFDGTDWTKNVEFDFTMEVRKVGFFAGNALFKGMIPGHTAIVDYFLNTASPFTAEDSRYKLSFDYEGSGTVQANPDKPGYYCGEPVELKAVPASGWGFLGWGDISGTNPNRVVNVDEDMSILARFQQGVVNQGYTMFMPAVIRPRP